MSLRPGEGLVASSAVFVLFVESAPIFALSGVDFYLLLINGTLHYWKTNFTLNTTRTIQCDAYER